MGFTHFNEAGQPKMVSIGEKNVTARTAVAVGSVKMAPSTIELIKLGQMKKGDVLTTAQIAGIMGAKQTSALIPMCHNILIEGVDLNFAIDEEESRVKITATVQTTGKTGVEMEALTAVSICALAIYDMCKAVDKGMVIEEIKLVKKTGGKSDLNLLKE
jgi:cyclic pyranopterin phosphate synthase